MNYCAEPFRPWWDVKQYGPGFACEICGAIMVRPRNGAKRWECMSCGNQKDDPGEKMKTMSLQEFQDALRAQGVDSHEEFAFVCPMCETVQNGRDLIAVGAGETFDEIEKHLAFSCVGRWTNAGPPRKTKNDGKACNWTLGGLFTVHKLEVVTPDGEKHPRFELATPEQAQELVRQQKAKGIWKPLEKFAAK